MLGPFFNFFVSWKNVLCSWARSIFSKCYSPCRLLWEDCFILFLSHKWGLIWCTNNNYQLLQHGMDYIPSRESNNTPALALWATTSNVSQQNCMLLVIISIIDNGSLFQVKWQKIRNTLSIFQFCLFMHATFILLTICHHITWSVIMQLGGDF